MLSETLLDNSVMVKLQLVIADAGLVNVALGLMAIAATIIAVDYAHMLYLRSKMPPGPVPLPIVGNTFSLPDNKPWIYFEELSKKYNTPLITFWIGRSVNYLGLLSQRRLTTAATPPSGSTMPGAPMRSLRKRPRSTRPARAWLCSAN